MELYITTFFNNEWINCYNKTRKERKKTFKEFKNNMNIYDGNTNELLEILMNTFDIMIQDDKEPQSYNYIVKYMNWIVSLIAYVGKLTIDVNIYKFACMIGNYRLIRLCFDNNIKPTKIIGNNMKKHDFKCCGFYYVTCWFIIVNYMGWFISANYTGGECNEPPYYC